MVEYDLEELFAPTLDMKDNKKSRLIKVYTKDGRYFKFTEYDYHKQIGYLKDDGGKVIDRVYFLNDSISAIECAEERIFD